MPIVGKFVVRPRASTIEGESELRNGSRIHPPVLIADSDATVEIGMANTSLASCDNTL